jgi:uncharacterized protein YbbK (DUF523 family)
VTGKILVSACLLGRPVRYDGSAKPLAHPALERWLKDGRIVAVCPELEAGAPVPRPPVEIGEGADGEDVLAGTARILDRNGRDETAAFAAGAEATLALAREHGCAFALLTDGSPSCGSRRIHDGSFTGRTHPGSGVVAALLRQHGIVVFPETEIDRLAEIAG